MLTHTPLGGLMTTHMSLGGLMVTYMALRALMVTFMAFTVMLLHMASAFELLGLATDTALIKAFVAFGLSPKVARSVTGKGSQVRIGVQVDSGYLNGLIGPLSHDGMREKS